MIKYPETFAEVGRQNVTLAANSKIRPLDSSDYATGESPMKAFKPWSVLNLNIANSETKSGGSGAIEVSHLADVKLRTEIAMKEIMENERKNIVNSDADSQSGAHALLDVKVFFLPREINSDMRGKSAIEITRVAGADNARLAAQNLRNSAGNNPKYGKSNLRQAEAMELAAIIVSAENTKLGTKTVKEMFAENMDSAMQTCGQMYQSNPNDPAVQVALALLEAIKKDATVLDVIKDNNSGTKVQSGNYKIYGPILKTPNIKKVDAQGYTKAYSLAIWCNPSQLPYPFHVELQTMMGKPLANRQVGVDGSTIKDRKTFSIDLMTWEWINVIERADWESKLIALWNHNEQYDVMVKSVDENRQAANNPQSVQSQYQQPTQNYGYQQYPGYPTY